VVINLLGFLSILAIQQDFEFDTDRIMEYVWDAVLTFLEAGVEIAQGFWDGAWDMFNVYVGLENAFYITMVLILTVSVYIILQRFVVNK